MNKADFHKRALFLSYFTVGYNVIEGMFALFAGSLTGSVSLVGFGLDSFVESLSGCIMIWRFGSKKDVCGAEEDKIEKKAIKLIGYTFFILGSYVLYESVKKLYLQEIPDPSLLGIALAITSLIVMPILFYTKNHTARSMGSKSLEADSKQTLTCMFLSIALLVGLGSNYLWGFWQADPIVGLLVVVFLFKEGYTVLKEEKVCSC